MNLVREIEFVIEISRPKVANQLFGVDGGLRSGQQDSRDQVFTRLVEFRGWHGAIDQTNLAGTCGG